MKKLLRNWKERVKILKKQQKKGPQILKEPRLYYDINFKKTYKQHLIRNFKLQLSQ